MEGSTITVTKLGSEQVPAAAGLLARAFAHDPIIGHYLSPGWRQQKAFKAFFQSALWEGLPAGQTFAAMDHGTLVGVALWFPPDEASAPCSKPMRSRVQMLFVQLLYPNGSRLLLEGFKATGAHHPPRPHWYLEFIGVEPAMQGRGVGPRLLAPVLAEADGHAQTCYLETPFSATHNFYRNLGFNDVKVLDCFPGAPTLTTFLRPPAAPRSS